MFFAELKHVARLYLGSFARRISDSQALVSGARANEIHSPDDDMIIGDNSVVDRNTKRVRCLLGPCHGSSRLVPAFQKKKIQTWRNSRSHACFALL